VPVNRGGPRPISQSASPFPFLYTLSTLLLFRRPFSPSYKCAAWRRVNCPCSGPLVGVTANTPLPNFFGRILFRYRLAPPPDLFACTPFLLFPPSVPPRLFFLLVPQSSAHVPWFSLFSQPGGFCRFLLCHFSLFTSAHLLLFFFAGDVLLVFFVTVDRAVSYAFHPFTLESVEGGYDRAPLFYTLFVSCVSFFFTTLPPHFLLHPPKLDLGYEGGQVVPPLVVVFPPFCV